MLVLNPSCELDQKSAEIVQELLHNLNHDAARTNWLNQQNHETSGRKSPENAAKCEAYCCGIRDTAHAILKALRLDSADEDYLYADDLYLLDPETAKVLFNHCPGVN